MPTHLATARRRSMRLPPLALGLLLVCLGQASAEDLQLRAASWAATSLAGRGDDVLAAPTFEVNAVQTRMPAGAPISGLGGRASDEMTGVNYRLWMTRGRAEFGVGLGSLGYLQPPAAAGPRAVIGAVPTVSLGMRYRVSDQHLLFADASGARGLGADPAATYLTTKVGLEWKPAKSSLGFEHGALGVQLDSGFRLSLKSRRGGPALYLRNTF